MGIGIHWPLYVLNKFRLGSNSLTANNFIAHSWLTGLVNDLSAGNIPWYQAAALISQAEKLYAKILLP